MYGIIFHLNPLSFIHVIVLIGHISVNDNKIMWLLTKSINGVVNREKKCNFSIYYCNQHIFNKLQQKVLNIYYCYINWENNTEEQHKISSATAQFSVQHSEKNSWYPHGIKNRFDHCSDTHYTCILQDLRQTNLLTCPAPFNLHHTKLLTCKAPINLHHTKLLTCIVPLTCTTLNC